MSPFKWIKATVDEAVELLSKASTRSSEILHTLGNDETSGLEIVVKKGRYGPYVTDGTVNATIPKGTDPEKVNLDEAVELLAKREAKLRAQGKDPRAKKKTTRRKKK